MTTTDFAAAQERIARRRAQRLRSHVHLVQQQELNLSSTFLNRLPTSLRDLSTSIIIRSSPIFGRQGTNPTFRVGQVDAELLDEELLDLLKAQIGEALKYYGGHLRDEWDAEILLALRAVLFKLTIWDHDASYGAALQNLRYTDARDKSVTNIAPKRWQKTLYGLFSVGGRYIWQKWEDYLLDVESSYDSEPSQRLRLLSRVSNLASTTHSLAAFASFLVFLLNGRYRTILDRLLRMRLMPTSSQVSRQVSFEYLNRQLVWHAFTEFLLFLLPLVGISRWRRWLARAWRKLGMFFSRSSGGADAEEEAQAKGELGFLPERTCAICYQDQNPTTTSENEVTAISAVSSGIVGSAQTDITNPYEAIPCGCVYCFVCLAQRIEGEDGEGWMCLRCGEVIKECRPWHGDVLVVEEKKVRKRVSFMEDHFEKDPEKNKIDDKDGNDSIDHSKMANETTNGSSRDIVEDVEKTYPALLNDSGAWADVDNSMGNRNGYVDDTSDLMLDDEEAASLAVLNGENTVEEEEEAEQQSWNSKKE